MTSEVEQLARSVQQVSLSCLSQKKPFRTPSFNGDVEEVASIGSDEDVDMSDTPCTADADELDSKDRSAEVEDSPRQMSTSYNKSGGQAVSTTSCQTSPVSLRREGRPSLGLSQELSSVFQSVVLPSMCFFLSQVPSLKGSTANSVRILGKISCVIVTITQVLEILVLSCSLFRTTLAGRAMRLDRLSKRRRASRASATSGRCAISAIDRIDNFIGKVLVCIILTVCRICVILLCCTFLGFSSMEDNIFLKAGIQNLDSLAKMVLDFSFDGVLNANIDANILQECKTIPELVFENRNMCT